MRTQADNIITPIRPMRGTAVQPPARVEVVIPAHNQERALPGAVRQLHARLATDFPVPFRITIADNASSDNTASVARFLARELSDVRYMHIPQQGRGRALRAAWSASDAEVVAYMDVDLSTDVAHLGALLGPLLAGRADIVVGSRLAPGAQVARGFRREAISRSYNALLGAALSAVFSDAQCGFKAARREVISKLLPLIEDEGWFFDTELLYLAQRNAFSIREVPVRWVDDPDSRVHIAQTVIDDLRGIARLRRRTREGRDLIAQPDSGAPARERSAVGRLRTPRHDHPHRAAARPKRLDGCASGRPDTQPATPALP
jgi:glycosyltransferase involved in cell wall biosynthesis